MIKRGSIAIIIIIGMFSLGMGTVYDAYCKDYPTKPIELIVPYGPGGSGELTARLISEVVKKNNLLGEPLVVNCKPGATGSVAAADIIGSKPDGYKIGIFPETYFSTSVKSQNVSFDPTHLAPLINLTEMRNGMLVKNDAPWKSLGQLLDYGKQNSGKLRWSHQGRGIVLSLQVMAILKKAGVEAIDIPYKSAPEVLASLLGGHVDMATVTLSAVIDHLKAKTVRALVVYSERRYADIPDVPNLAELGFKELVIPLFNGIYVHKDTPETVRKTLFDALKKTYEDPDFKKGIQNIGEEPRLEGPEFIKQAIRKGEEISVPALKELGLYGGGK
jgi:tripartite-type tricarboxylate transporter receptor subunit TctC